MGDAFIIGVPSADQAELTLLAEQIGSEGKLSEQRFFDGAAFIETLVPIVLSAAAWATLRTWIRARANVRMATRISIDGIEFTALSAKDAERLIVLLGERLTVPDVDE